MTLDNLTTFTAGTKAKASEVNANFSLVEEAINTNSNSISSLNSSKAELISLPTDGNIVTTNSSGQSVDSGKSFNDDGITSDEIWSANKVNSEVTLLNSTITTKTSYISQQYWSKISNSNSDSEHDIKFSAGKQPDKTLQMVMNSSELVKQIDNTWSNGSNAGGFPSGLTLSPNTTYHCFIISKNDRDLKTSMLLDFETSLTNDEYGNTITSFGGATLSGGKCSLDGTGGITQSSINSFNSLPWEISQKVNLSSMPSASPYYNYIFRTNTMAIQLLVDQNGSLKLYLSSDNSSFDIANSLVVKTGMTSNIEYTIKLLFTGTHYQVWSSTDAGLNWTKDYELASTSKIADFGTIIWGGLQSTSTCMTGTLDDIKIKLIRETTDAGFDTSLTASNLLACAADYTNYRRVGSIVTDDNSNIRQFLQKGDEFMVNATPVVKTGSTPNTATTITFDEIPTGILLKAKVNYYNDQVTANKNGWVYSPLVPDRTPSSSSHNIRALTGSVTNFNEEILTTTASIKHIFEGTGLNYTTSAYSWIDLFED